MALIPFLVYHVTADGWKFIGNFNVGPLYWEYKDQAAQ
jgi:hypothetical protein